jgi:hypothetical protein
MRKPLKMYGKMTEHQVAEIYYAKPFKRKRKKKRNKAA